MLLRSASAANSPLLRFASSRNGTCLSLTTHIGVKLRHAPGFAPLARESAGRRRRALLVSRAMAGDTISFARGAPSADILPHEAVRDAAAVALAEDWEKALSYGTGIGHPGSASGSPSGTVGSTPRR